MKKIFLVFFIFALVLFSISAQEAGNEEGQISEGAESGEGEVTNPGETTASGEGEVSIPEENAETPTEENNETTETEIGEGETEIGEGETEIGENGETGETPTEEGASTPETEEDDDAKFEEEAEPKDVYPVGSLGPGGDDESDSQGEGEVVVVEEGENGETDPGQLENGEHDLIIDIGGSSASSSSKVVASLGALCLGLLVHFMV